MVIIIIIISSGGSNNDDSSSMIIMFVRPLAGRRLRLEASPRWLPV